VPAPAPLPKQFAQHRPKPSAKHRVRKRKDAGGLSARIHARTPMGAESRPTNHWVDAIDICAAVILIRTWYLIPAPQPQNALGSGASKTIACLRRHHHRQRQHLHLLRASHARGVDVQSERLSLAKRNQRQLNGVLCQKRQQTKQSISSSLKPKRKRINSSRFAGSLAVSTWTNNYYLTPVISRALDPSVRKSNHGPLR
jgi:hypothetical protein